MQIEDGVLQITKASNGKFVSKIENHNFGPKDNNFFELSEFEILYRT